MSEGFEAGLSQPPVEDLEERAGSRFGLVVIAAKRARQINSYYNGLAEGLLEHVGPTVEADRGDQPLTVALREVAAGNLEVTTGTAEAETTDTETQSSRPV